MFKFTTRSNAPLQYLDADAKRLLAIIGKEALPQGIITVEQLALGREALERAIAQEQERAAQPQDTAQEDEGDVHSGGAGAVSLRNRALPLLELLRSCEKLEESIVWQAQ